MSAYEASKAYDATQVARVRGAVKLQAAVRRRQSRGIFAQVEAESSQVPGPGHYAPELLPQLAKAKRPAPAASEVELANAATKALLASTLNTLDEATAALESLAVDEGEEKSADAAAAEEEAEEQQAAPASPPLSPLRSGAMLSQQIAPSPLQMPSAIKLPAEAAYAPSPAAYERLSSAPLLPRLSADADELAMSPVVREPPKGRLSRVVSLDMWLAEMDDDDTNGMASVREEGEEELEAAPLSVSGEMTTAVEEEEEEEEEGDEDPQDGDWLFSQLERICDVRTSRAHTEVPFFERAQSQRPAAATPFILAF